MVARTELPSIAAKPLQTISGSLIGPVRMFNAILQELYLGDGLPEQDSNLQPSG